MHMVSHIYTVILEPQPEGGFIVTVPALPEVQSAGDSEAEALARTHDAIAVVLTFRRDYDMAIPSDVVPLLRTVMVEVQEEKFSDS